MESNLADNMEMMNITGSPLAPSSSRRTLKPPGTPSSALVLPERLARTSTPSTASYLPLKVSSNQHSSKFAFSPLACVSGKRTPVKASDVFDISDSFMMMDIDVDEQAKKTCQKQNLSQEDVEEKQEKMCEEGEDSFDQFDLPTQETPFAERVMKRMNC